MSSRSGGSRNREEGAVLDVYPRAPAAAGEEGFEGNQLDEREGVGEIGAGGGSELRLCTLGAQSPLNVERRVRARGGKGTDGTRDRAPRDHLLQRARFRRANRLWRPPP